MALNGPANKNHSSASVGLPVSGLEFVIPAGLMCGALVPTNRSPFPFLLLLVERDQRIFLPVRTEI